MNQQSKDIQWKESDFHNGTSGEQEKNEENDDLFAMFADPEPFEIFEFQYSPNVKIRLRGQKQENGQLLHSTGLTLWRASETLSRYIFDHPESVRGKFVVELGAGLGLCGILSHKIGATRVLATDGDNDTMLNLLENALMNHCDPTQFFCRQLIWGRSEQYPSENADVVMGADIVYTEQMLDPLWETVAAILSPTGIFMLSCTRRNIPIESVYLFAAKHRFVCDSSISSGKGVALFRRMNPK